MVAEWIPLRAYATARGVTPDAISKAIRAGKLGLPHRKSNSDGRGTLEVLADLTELEPAPPPVADQSATVEALRAHLASVCQATPRFTRYGDTWIYETVRVPR